MICFRVSLIIFAWLSGSHNCLPFKQRFPLERHVEVRNGVAKPFYENNCANSASIRCADPSFCFELLYCDCEPGWTGILCTTPCTLPCVNGRCLVNEFPINSTVHTQFCNCPHNYEGELCEIEVLEPERHFSFSGRSKIYETLNTLKVSGANNIVT